MFTLADGRPVPGVITARMRDVDRAMTARSGIELAQMMENAGRNLAGPAARRYAPGLPWCSPGRAETGAAGWSQPGTWPTGGWESPRP